MVYLTLGYTPSGHSQDSLPIMLLLLFLSVNDFTMLSSHAE